MHRKLKGGCGLGRPLRAQGTRGGAGALPIGKGSVGSTVSRTSGELTGFRRFSVASLENRLAGGYGGRHTQVNRSEATREAGPHVGGR